MLTYFQHSFTVRLSRKLVIKSYLNVVPHLKRVATLPCEISVQKIPRRVPFMGISQYPVYWVFFIKTPFGKGSTRVSEIVRGFMYQRTIDLQQNEKEFQY